jgi:hypothetical protein
VTIEVSPARSAWGGVSFFFSHRTHPPSPVNSGPPPHALDATGIRSASAEGHHDQHRMNNWLEAHTEVRAESLDDSANLLIAWSPNPNQPRCQRRKRGERWSRTVLQRRSFDESRTPLAMPGGETQLLHNCADSGSQAPTSEVSTELVLGALLPRPECRPRTTSQEVDGRRRFVASPNDGHWVKRLLAKCGL